jgi:hypothetical protein
MIVKSRSDASNTAVVTPATSEVTPATSEHQEHWNHHQQKGCQQYNWEIARAETLAKIGHQHQQQKKLQQQQGRQWQKR